MCSIFTHTHTHERLDQDICVLNSGTPKQQSTTNNTMLSTLLKVLRDSVRISDSGSTRVYFYKCIFSLVAEL